jgi:hypothetical protein
MRSEGDIASDRVVSGLPRLLLRREGAALLALAVFFYARYSSSWWLFAMLLLAPDVGMLGYLANPQVGALAYNVFHAYLLPSVLVVVGVVNSNAMTSSVGSVWFAPIGMDRALGDGLTYAENVKHTPQRSRMVRQALRRGEIQGAERLGDPEGGGPPPFAGAPSECLAASRSPRTCRGMTR